MTCRDDVLAAVDQYWRGAKEIHRRVDCWTHSGVRHKLVLLASERLIETRTAPIPNGHVKLEYRLARKDEP